MTDKDEHALVRFGGILTQGLMELGGRNCTVKLTSNSGNNRIGSIVGMALFTQYYYWFPMVHFINLAVHPSMLLGVDSSLKVVKNFNVLSKAKPSQFGYPKEVKLEEKTKIERAPSAVLSTQSRVKAKLGRRTGTLTSIADMQIDDKPAADKNKTDKAAIDKPADKEKTEEKPEEPEKEEPNEEKLSNPSRIVPRQLSVVSHIQDQDFRPILNNRFTGFIVLNKANPNALTEYVGDEVKTEETNKQSEPAPTTQGNNYTAIPTHDVEMPEEFELKDVNKK